MERTTAPLSADVTFRDGLGERRPLPNPDGEGAREMLGIRGELAAVPAFDLALRERLTQLSSFRHAYYAHAHEVQQLTDADYPIGLVSDHVDGIRLSELFTRAAGRGLNLDINAALCLIRQLVPAVAKFHETSGDLAHAALGPERVVVTPNARLVITEYVLGPALEQLRYSQERYWKDLRIALPRSAGLPRFDQRADVTQIGVIALSLVLGRLLRDDEYPLRVGDVVASAWAVSPKGGFEPLPTGIRGWLGRALQLDVRNSFANAIEANAELEQVLSDSEYMGSPASLESFLARYEAAEVLEQFASEVLSTPMPAEPPATERLVTAPFERGAAPVEESLALASAPALVPASIAAPVVVAAVPNEAETIAPAVPIAATLKSESEPEAETRPLEPDPAVRIAVRPRPDMFGQPEPSSYRWATWTVAGVAVVAVLVAVGLPLRRSMSSVAPAAAPTTGTLAITTDPPGAMAVIDGQPSGTTPLTLTLPAGSHTVELRGDGAPRVLPVTIMAGSQSSQYIELPKQLAVVGQLNVRSEPAGAMVTVDGVRRGAAPMMVADLTPGEHVVILEGPGGSVRQPVMIEGGGTASLVVPMTVPDPAAAASGWLSVTSPIELQIREGERVLGTSLTDRIMLPVGRHEVELVNEGLGFRASRSVQVTAGKLVAVSVDLPNGTIALNALPWADVWLDGERIGETPIGNLPVRIGVHEVVLKHPELGEQRHRLTVGLMGVSRLSVDLRRP
jgi:hypothetical protein